MPLIKCEVSLTLKVLDAYPSNSANNIARNFWTKAKTIYCS